MTRNYMNHLFTDSVKQVQTRFGSRESQSRHEGGPLERDTLSQFEADFIAARDSFYMSTVNTDGWPYLQFRGGPTGFLKVLDERTLAYADFRGNRQYISMGNIDATKRAALFFMDYPNQRRLKLMANSEIIPASERPDLLPLLTDPEYKGPIERIVLFYVVAHDWNCPQHITPRFTEHEWDAIDK